MGVEIVQVPLDWHHPTDAEGEYIVGGHHEPLYDLPVAERTAFRLYENVSEGSPVSPVFATTAELDDWLTQNGWTEQSRQFLLSNGHAPSFSAGENQVPTPLPLR